MAAKFWNHLGVALLLFPVSYAAGQPTVRYRDEIFASYAVQSNIPYGQVFKQPLYLDLYTGAGDTATHRPLVIFIHAGGFQTGDKATVFARLTCSALARRGYVAASIQYRLTASIAGDTAYFEAMLRAMHDAKAAVRFFRKYGSAYGVDTGQIFAVGSSAGSITALHLAYLDSTEVPPYVNWSRVDSTFEGSSGNPGFSSRVQGVVSNWGAIGDTAWITKGAVPVYCVHGTADSTIYYNLIPAYGPFQYSSRYIIQAAQEKGIPNGLRLFVGAGHELNGDTTKEDSAINDFSAWLFTILRGPVSSVEPSLSSRPAAFALEQNFPNPFNPSTTIQFSITHRDRVTLTVYDVLGRRVAELADGTLDAGAYRVRFDASGLASGLYVARLKSGYDAAAIKILLLR